MFPPPPGWTPEVVTMFNPNPNPPPAEYARVQTQFLSFVIVKSLVLSVLLTFFLLKAIFGLDRFLASFLRLVCQFCVVCFGFLTFVVFFVCLFQSFFWIVLVSSVGF